MDMSKIPSDPVPGQLNVYLAVIEEKRPAVAAEIRRLFASLSFEDFEALTGNLLGIGFLRQAALRNEHEMEHYAAAYEGFCSNDCTLGHCTVELLRDPAGGIAGAHIERNRLTGEPRPSS